MLAPKTILVPTDFSEFSNDALEVAYDMAKQYQAKIYLLHVVEAIHQCTVDYCIQEGTVEELEKQILASSENMMREQIEKFNKSNDVEIITDIRKGTAYREILAEAQARNVDVIVIASHGKTGFLGHLIGSVADKVTREAKCPVILVRKK